MSDYDDKSTNRTKAWSLIYEPLPEGDYLRILILQPGNYDDDIVCNLKIQTHRRSRDKYAAISYVWGDPDDTVDITCNDSVASITRNLADALRVFRHPRTIRRLWADALCINQNDIEEKGHQVGKMGRVYQNALKVLVWLGKDHMGFAEDCFRMIEKTNEYLDEVFERHNQEYWSMPRLKAPYPIPVDEETWSRVNELMLLPWFDRVWTVQECAIAKECRMFWGLHHIDVADVFEISLWSAQYVDLSIILEGYGLERCNSLLAIFQTIHDTYSKGTGWQYSKTGLWWEAVRWSISSLSKVLNVGRCLAATDPRDHVFAFLDCHFAKDKNGQPILLADYSLSMEEAWHRVACTLVKHPREGPWMLSAVKHEHRDVIVKLDRPSWVPYWNISTGLGMLGVPGWYVEAGGPTNLFAAKPRGERTLEILGFIFDSIVWKTPPMKQDEFTLQRSRDSKRYLADEPSIDRLWRQVSLAAEDLGFTLDENAFTMALECSWFHPSTELEDHQDFFRAYCEVARSEYSGTIAMDNQTSSNEEIEAKATSVMYRLNWSTRDKSLFLTRSGRIGLACGTLIEVGDVCCIFSGVNVPFILTPAANSWHKLVDECYISGVMQGQLLEEFETGPIFLK